MYSNSKYFYMDNNSKYFYSNKTSFAEHEIAKKTFCVSFHKNYIFLNIFCIHEFFREKRD